MMQMFSGASSGGWFEKRSASANPLCYPSPYCPQQVCCWGSAGRYRIQIRLLRIHFRRWLATGHLYHHEQRRLDCVCKPVGTVCCWGRRWAGENDKGTAGLAALLAYLVMNATINALLILTGKLAHENPGAVGQGMTLGIQTLETGVFGSYWAGDLRTASSV